MERPGHQLASPRLAVIAAAFLLAGCAAPALAERTAGDLEREDFLRQAEIGKLRTIEIGVTSSLRATLSLGGVSHDAHIQRIDAHLRRFRTPKRTYANFRDSYKYNIAAYRLDRLLDLNMVPVSVERKVRGDQAAVTWWVDDVLMMEVDRRRDGIHPPDAARWNDQLYQARVLNQLAYNADPNMGNILITTDWRLWLIDFTRAFRPWAQLEQPELLIRIDRRLYRGLQDLDAERLRLELADYLTGGEIKALLRRRDKLLAHFAARVEELGEAAVICDLPGH